MMVPNILGTLSVIERRKMQADSIRSQRSYPTPELLERLELVDSNPLSWKVMEKLTHDLNQYRIKISKLYYDEDFKSCFTHLIDYFSKEQPYLDENFPIFEHHNIIYFQLLLILIKTITKIINTKTFSKEGIILSTHNSPSVVFEDITSKKKECAQSLISLASQAFISHESLLETLDYLSPLIMALISCCTDWSYQSVGILCSCLNNWQLNCEYDKKKEEGPSLETHTHCISSSSSVLGCSDVFLTLLRPHLSKIISRSDIYNVVILFSYSLLNSDDASCLYEAISIELSSTQCLNRHLSHDMSKVKWYSLLQELYKKGDWSKISVSEEIDDTMFPKEEEEEEKEDVAQSLNASVKKTQSTSIGKDESLPSGDSEDLIVKDPSFIQPLPLSDSPSCSFHRVFTSVSSLPLPPVLVRLFPHSYPFADTAHSHPQSHSSQATSNGSASSSNPTHPTIFSDVFINLLSFPFLHSSVVDALEGGRKGASDAKTLAKEWCLLIATIRNNVGTRTDIIKDEEEEHSSSYATDRDEDTQGHGSIPQIHDIPAFSSQEKNDDAITEGDPSSTTTGKRRTSSSSSASYSSDLQSLEHISSSKLARTASRLLHILSASLEDLPSDSFSYFKKKSFILNLTSMQMISNCVNLWFSDSSCSKSGPVLFLSMAIICLDNPSLKPKIATAKRKRISIAKKMKKHKEGSKDTKNQTHDTPVDTMEENDKDSHPILKLDNSKKPTLERSGDRITNKSSSLKQDFQSLPDKIGHSVLGSKDDIFEGKESAPGKGIPKAMASSGSAMSVKLPPSDTSSLGPIPYSTYLLSSRSFLNDIFLKNAVHTLSHAYRPIFQSEDDGGISLSKFSVPLTNPVPSRRSGIGQRRRSRRTMQSMSSSDGEEETFFSSTSQMLDIGDVDISAMTTPTFPIPSGFYPPSSHRFDSVTPISFSVFSHSLFSKADSDGHQSKDLKHVGDSQLMDDGSLSLQVGEEEQDYQLKSDQMLKDLKHFSIHNLFGDGIFFIEEIISPHHHNPKKDQSTVCSDGTSKCENGMTSDSLYLKVHVQSLEECSYSSSSHCILSIPCTMLMPLALFRLTFVSSMKTKYLQEILPSSCAEMTKNFSTQSIIPLMPTLFFPSLLSFFNILESVKSIFGGEKEQVAVPDVDEPLVPFEDILTALKATNLTKLSLILEQTGKAAEVLPISSPIPVFMTNQEAVLVKHVVRHLPEVVSIEFTNIKINDQQFATFLPNFGLLSKVAGIAIVNCPIDGHSLQSLFSALIVSGHCDLKSIYISSSIIPPESPHSPSDEETKEEEGAEEKKEEERISPSSPSPSLLPEGLCSQVVFEPHDPFATIAHFCTELGGALGSCSSLNSLCFSGCEFGDDKIEKFAESFASSRYLARGVSLSVMYFAECSLTDASLPSIEKLMLCGIRSSVSKDTSEGVSEGVSEDIADDVSEIASLSLRSNVLSIASATRICSICSPKMT
ncbi:hypothetical protein ADUPG1_013685, partial [Aduncisulcus paluster]